MTAYISRGVHRHRHVGRRGNFLVGVFASRSRLAFLQSQLRTGRQGYLNFEAAFSPPAYLGGDLRLRGQRAYCCTSFYVVQPHQCGAGSGAGTSRWFVFCGAYQLFHRAGGGRLCAVRGHPIEGIRGAEWYGDLWLTIVWVALSEPVFLGTIIKRKGRSINRGELFLFSVVHRDGRRCLQRGIQPGDSRVRSGGRSRSSFYSGVQDAMVAVVGRAQRRVASS